MILNDVYYSKIAQHFGNKFPCIQYVGCWGANSITFALYQDERKTAGFELIIERPKGDELEIVNVINVKRLNTYYKHNNGVYAHEMLPIFRTVQPINKLELYK